MTQFFYIVATVYVMLSGKPVNPEGTKQFFQHKFETMDECKAYLTGDEFPQHRSELALMFSNRFGYDQKPEIAIVASCEAYDQKGTEGGI